MCMIKQVIKGILIDVKWQTAYVCNTSKYKAKLLPIYMQHPLYKRQYVRT